MNIFLIGEYIAPVQAVASIRWTKIAKYIKRSHDVSITVLTDQKNWDHKKDSVLHNSPKKDEMLLRDMGVFSQYYEVPCGRLTMLYLTLRKWVRGNVESNVGMTTSQAEAPRGFLKPLKSAAKWAVFDIREYLHARDLWNFYKNKIQQKPDVVISSYSPAWAHLVGEKIKRADPNILWLADFRDPYVSDFSDALTKKRHMRFTMKHCAVADMVLRISDTLLTYTPSQVPVCMVSNGYDPEEAAPPLKPAHFDLVFTGVLYGDRRDIGIVCEALKQLCAEGQMSAEDVAVVYAGKDDALARDLAKKHHAEEFLQTTGLLPRIKARELQQTAAILLQANWNTATEKCCWSGKMYEYMAAQKPIIYLVSGDVPYSEPSEQIHLLGGYCYEEARHAETYPAMKQYILEKYLEWKQTGNVMVQQVYTYVEQYSYVHIAERVWDLIQKETEQ